MIEQWKYSDSGIFHKYTRVNHLKKQLEGDDCYQDCSPNEAFQIWVKVKASNITIMAHRLVSMALQNRDPIWRPRPRHRKWDIKWHTYFPWLAASSGERQGWQVWEIREISEVRQIKGRGEGTGWRNGSMPVSEAIESLLTIVTCTPPKDSDL